MRTIQKIYANAYSNRQDQNFYIEIDCKHIAKKMKVDNELVFQRLYSHLEKKYGYTNADQSYVHFFSLTVGDKKHCINYPYLCAALSDLEGERKELRITQAFAIVSAIISIIALIKN